MNTEINEINLRLHHIAYATRNTDESIKMFSNIYPNIEHYKVLEKTQNIFFSYISNDYENYKIELVEPASIKSPVEKFISENDAALYHICYYVNNFKKGYLYFRNQGYVQASKPFQPSFNQNIVVCHFYSNYTYLIEIIGDNVE